MSSPVYVEYNYEHPSFGYAIGLFTLQCVVVLSLLTCMSFVCCCSNLCKGSKSSLIFDLSKFKIEKYSDIQMSDEIEFEVNIKPAESKYKKETPHQEIQQQETPQQEIQQQETPQQEIQQKTEQENMLVSATESQKNCTNTSTNNSEQPIQKSTGWGCIQSCTKSKSGLYCLVCCGLMCGPPFMFCAFIWEKIKQITCYTVRKITCGKFCKEPVDDKIKDGATTDIENKKKKYLVYNYKQLF